MCVLIVDARVPPSDIITSGVQYDRSALPIVPTKNTASCNSHVAYTCWPRELKQTMAYTAWHGTSFEIYVNAAIRKAPTDWTMHVGIERDTAPRNLKNVLFFVIKQRNRTISVRNV